VKRRAPLIAALALAVVGPSARADEPPAPAAPPVETAPDCSAARAARAPDPRCGEALDGRGPAPGPSAGRTLGRAALFLPRAITAGLFWPFIEATDVMETNHVRDWAKALLTSDDGKVGVRPVVNYATGFRPTGGLRAFYNRFPSEGSGVAASFQTGGPAILIGSLDVGGPRWTGLSLHGIFNRRDDRYFAGIGPLTSRDLQANGWEPSRYSSDIFLAEPRWTKRLSARFLLSVHADLQRRDYRADDVRGGPSIADVFRTPSPACQATTPPVNACVDPALVPGFQTGLRVAHEGATLAWEHRAQRRDGSGVALAVDATFAQGFADDPSRHVTLTAEPLAAWGGDDRQLLFHGRAVMVQALSDAPIPFEELAMMSGYAGMRGFPDGRFRGDSGVVATAEYRWYVSHTLDASLFTDLGTVAGHAFSGLAGAHWFPSYGVGLRLYESPDNYWEGRLMTGVQLIYAPDYGFRFIIAVASF
jgi:hypothetical protein